MAVEDERFYEHHGVDYQAVVGALVLNVQAGTGQGGSPSPSSTSRTPTWATSAATQRKLREAILAWHREDRWSKDDILRRLPQQGVLRRPGLRRRGGGAHLLQQARLGTSTSRRRRCWRRCPSPHPPTRPPPSPRWPGSSATRCCSSWPTRPLRSRRRAPTSRWRASSSVLAPAELQQERLADYFVNYVTKILVKRFGRPRCSTAASRSPPASTSSGAGGHRHHQEHQGAAGLRLQAVGRPGRHRPGQRLHPHDGRRARLRSRSST